MNILNIMYSLGLAGSMKQKLLRLGIPEKEMEGVDFSDLGSLNKFAERIMPNLLRSNPTVAKQIKDSGMLKGEEQERVANVIDGL